MIRTVIFKILILLLFMILVKTSHFEGGTITYKVVNTSGSTVSIMITQTYIYRWAVIYCDNAEILSQSMANITTYSDYTANLTCVANCTTTGGYIPISVVGSCTDYSSVLSISVTERTDIVNLTIGAYFTVAFVGGNWRSLSLPTGSGSSNTWSIACTIDLIIRSDTGKINTPPVATMISPIYIPVGKRTSLFIPTIDGDNDIVRCRFGNSTTECQSVCPPSSLPNNTVIISNCTLFITGANVSDWYAITLQIEDFPNSNSTTPLSSVPVQFLINVQALPNCTNPPLLYGPSNQTGACETLQVGQANTLILYAVNYCSSYGVTIQDIATLSFPIVTKSNLTQNSSTLYSVTLTWTPTANQVGSQILCAVAIDSQNVQSNQYCVAFVVSENSTGACPGAVLETTTPLTTTAEITTAAQIFDTSTSFIDTLITSTKYEQNSANDTTAMTTNTTVNTTTSSSSTEWPWLLPFVSVLASLLPPFCCICICCPPPCGFGYRRYKRDRPLEPLSNPDETRRIPTMYMIGRVFGESFDNDSRSDSSLASPRNITSSSKHSDRFPLTVRNHMNKKGKDVVWVYPSLPSDNVNGHANGLSNSRNPAPSDKHLNLFPLTLRNNANKTEKNVVQVHPSDNTSGHDKNLTKSRSATTPDNHFDPFPLTLRNRTNTTPKNVVWIHPSPQLGNVNERDSSLPSPSSITESDIHLNVPSPTPRKNANKTGKNIAWVRPPS